MNLTAKAAEYEAPFYPAKVTDMNDYVSQTMGSILEQLKMVTAPGMALALGVAVLITALFFKMQIAKESAQIAIMRSLGFSGGHIRTQCITRALAVLALGIALGTLAGGALGPGMAVLLLTGVSRLEFAGNPAISYLLCPLVLAGVVAATVWLGSFGIDKIDVMSMNRE